MIDLLFADDGTHSHIINTLSGISDLNLSSVTDSKKVLEILKEKRPEIILLGNLKDGISRHTLTRILKNDTDTASIIILFIETSKEDTELMSKVCGTNPIRTPLDINILQETLLNAASTK